MIRKKNNSEVTLDLIKDLLSQYDSFEARCRNYIINKQWSSNGIFPHDDSDEIDVDELARQEGMFQKEITTSLAKIINSKSKHKDRILEFEIDVLNGYKFEQDVEKQKYLYSQYESILDRIKQRIEDIDWTKDANIESRHREGLFQIKMIIGIENMLTMLEESIGIDVNSSDSKKARGGKEIDPFTDVLINEGIEIIKDQPLNLAYRNWLKNSEIPNHKNKFEYINFWKKHLSYCKTGVYCGGQYFSGWLYFHINLFKLTFNQKNNETGIAEPIETLAEFRDNEWYFEQAYNDCQKTDFPFIGVGTRRYTKSVIEISRILWRNLIFKDSKSLIALFSTKDLKDMDEYYSFALSKMPNCFKDITMVGSIGKSPIIELKIRLSENAEDIKYSSTTCIVVEEGKKGKSEKIAGGKGVIEAVFDEIGKEKYKKTYMALRFGLTTSDGKLSCNPILLGTGGDVHSSVDCEADFLNAEKNGFFHYDSSKYANLVNGFKYKQQSDNKVGFFMPAEMSAWGGQKISIPFSEYINRDFTEEQLYELEGLYIKVTDFDKAKENCLRQIELFKSEKNEDALKAEMYLPFQPEDCFKYDQESGFDIALARQVQYNIRFNELKPKYVWLTEDKISNKIIAEKSEYLPCSTFPFEGGVYNAPVQIFEEPICDTPPFSAYVAGMDCYKQDISKGASMGSLYIMKRIGTELKIVACYVSRPKMQHTFNMQCYLLLKLYNARCLCELEDMASFKTFLDSKNATDLYLEKGLHLAKSLNKETATSSEYGFSRTPIKNIEYLLSCEAEYLDKPYEVSLDENGSEVTSVVGMEVIPDDMLLEEYVKSSKIKNVDRRIGFQLALGLAKWYYIKGIIPKNISERTNGRGIIYANSGDSEHTLPSRKYNHNTYRGELNGKRIKNSRIRRVNDIW